MLDKNSSIYIIQEILCQNHGIIRSVALYKKQIKKPQKPKIITNKGIHGKRYVLFN